MIDTHCHLTDPRLFEQIEDVLTRAAAAGVERMISIGTDPEDDEKTVAVCRGRPQLRCAIGVHPNYCEEAELMQLPRIAKLAEEPCVIALGEMGLDYNRQFADRKRQASFFEAQLQIAVDLNLPVVIHSREAIDDTLAIMKTFPGIRAVVHCFTGTLAEAKRVIEAGYYLGFTGVVTFKKLDELRECARITPADRLLVETDAPYLSPEPVRNQKICEPALVMHTARRVAEVRGITLEELDRITTRNAEALFNWKR